MVNAGCGRELMSATDLLSLLGPTLALGRKRLSTQSKPITFRILPPGHFDFGQSEYFRSAPPGRACFQEAVKSHALLEIGRLLE
jgi:hypothetical protein